MSGIVGHRGLLLGSNGPLGDDPYWANVALLIDGTQGEIADLGPLALSISAHGSAAVVGGGGAGYLSIPGSGSAYLVTAANAGNAFAFGVGDFTIEVDSWRGASEAAIEAVLIDTRRASDSPPRRASNYVSTSGQLAVYDSSSVIGNTGAVLSTDAWHRVVFSRIGGTIVAYVDGARVWSASYAGSYANRSPCFIGNNYADSAIANHRMRHIRVTNGVSRYGNNATITQDAAPFPHA